MKLDNEEKEILRSFEKGEWSPAKNINSLKKRYARYAQTTLKKDKRLNIRISLRDLEGIQRMAVSEGLPYQTLVSSIIHKYVTKNQ